MPQGKEGEPDFTVSVAVDDQMEELEVEEAANHSVTDDEAFDFEVDSNLTVVCLPRRGKELFFAVREWDQKVFRKGANVLRLRPAARSEQSLRAGVRSSIVALGLTIERATPSEIAMLKQRNILGKRAPSCGLLAARDMHQFLLACGQDKRAARLQANLQALNYQTNAAPALAAMQANAQNDDEEKQVSAAPRDDVKLAPKKRLAKRKRAQDEDVSDSEPHSLPQHHRHPYLSSASALKPQELPDGNNFLGFEAEGSLGELAENRINDMLTDTYHGGHGYAYDHDVSISVATSDVFGGPVRPHLLTDDAVASAVTRPRSNFLSSLSDDFPSDETSAATVTSASISDATPSDYMVDDSDSSATSVWLDAIKTEGSVYTTRGREYALADVHNMASPCSFRSEDTLSATLSPLSVPLSTAHLSWQAMTVVEQQPFIQFRHHPTTAADSYSAMVANALRFHHPQSGNGMQPLHRHQFQASVMLDTTLPRMVDMQTRESPTVSIYSREPVQAVLATCNTKQNKSRAPAAKRKKIQKPPVKKVTTSNKHRTSSSTTKSVARPAFNHKFNSPVSICK